MIYSCFLETSDNLDGASTESNIVVPKQNSIVREDRKKKLDLYEDSRKYCKRLRSLKPISYRNTCEASCEETPYEPVQHTTEEIIKIIPRKNFSWTESLISKFDACFGKYARREMENPMPSRQEMEEFVNTNSLKISFTKIRNRINNERAKHDAIREQNLKKLKCQ
ncbi:uncharacterized protein LOC130645971 [Hydractinia symbiolongicarpus]|uniref:uncharacterized protein LOC130645971 n=1 Tax=Hydractinia symbiolongicarpus TaxID=13093 RepID=UPI00254A48B7|nr:uncharacterized protein LOC130645971 [Hydractinia symbiolongicarpus]